MGMLVGAGFLTLLVTGGLGLAGFLVHFYYWSTQRRGSWLLFFAITTVVALACAALGWVTFSSQVDSGTTGAPTTEQYEAALLGSVLFCAAPGLGMAAGSLAVLLHRRRRPG